MIRVFDPTGSNFNNPNVVGGDCDPWLPGFITCHVNVAVVAQNISVYEYCELARKLAI